MVMRIHRAPVYGSSLSDLFGLEREIENLFDGFLSDEVVSSPRFPAIDIAEKETESELIAEMPGVGKEDVRISMRDGVLTISGERKATALPDDSRWIRNETPAGQFSRSLTVPHEVKTDAITAELKNGILRVVLPKAETARPRAIMVK